MVSQAAVWRVAAAACAVGALIAGAGTAGAAPTPPPSEGRILGADRAGAVKGSYIVTFKASVARADVDRTARSLAGRHGGRIGHTYTAALRGFSVKVDEAQARRLAADPSVARVEADGVAYALGTQSDPTWGLDRIDQRDLPGDRKFTYPDTASNVTAYVLDTGIRTSHQEFGGRAVSGYDFIDNDSVAQDCNGHGTHVAGTVGGAAYGVAKAVKLVGVRVLNCQGSSGSTWAPVLAGIDWVTKNAVKPAVANMSIGGGRTASVDDALAKSIASGVTYVVAAGNDGANAFPYELARRAAYEAVAEPERPVLHLRAARALARHGGPLPLVRVAEHYRCAGLRSQAVRCLEAAADRAARSGDAGTATDRYLDALHGGPSAVVRDRVALKLARVALNARTGPQVPAALRNVLGRCSLGPGPSGEIRLLLGLLLRNQSGSGLEALEEIARAVPDLLAVSTGQAARALAIIAIPSLKGWPVGEHRRLLAEAERLLPQVDEEDLRSAVLANRATALALMGDPSAWDAVADLPEALTVETAARVHANLAGAATALGHPERARAFQARAWQAVRTNHAPYLEAFVETTDMLAAFTSGRWAGLLERAERAEEQYQDVPDFHAETLLVCGLLRLHTKGQTDVARRLLERAVRTTALDTGIVLTSAAAAVVRVHLAADRPAQAVQAVEGVLHHLRRTGAWVWATALAPPAVQALIRDGRDGEAHHLATELADGIARRDAPAARAALLTCRALLTATTGPQTGAGGSDALYAAAADAWAALERPYEAAYVREAWGLRLLAAGARGGRAVLHEAIAAYQDIDAVWDVLRCQRGLREHGQVTVRRPGALGYGDHLSPRERAVARLVSLGLSNREIARELVLSHRTVEHHVARALRKLGVSSRTQIGSQLGP
ncbi:S8 family serine peptidase [Streptomyces sp. ISL-112]|uniref:S8 family serine peptidase n=1 Tax=unclassified Streptomyces TaxID=2593676 RepID=UPI001BEC9FE7|nr:MULTISPECIES: S8 family serine peptidase [unclassified Streptomyces]MBT2428317.1 S8 family serine peptidase [Streptomyces sp. ISL-112]MBT2466234.1 S8 family serine peptidase [Streptomyces sp. ISL-63]